MTIKIRHVIEDNSTELWINGVFTDSWSITDIPQMSEGRVLAMMQTCFDQGRKHGLKQVRDVLGIE